MTTQEYINSISNRHSTGISREHSYRGDLQLLLETMLTGVLVTNEPARFAFGAPDYILTKKDVPVGFIEAKDIGDADLKGLKKSGNKEQFDRYKDSLENIIFTDYLDFLLYRDGEFVTSIRIGEIVNGKIVAKPENFQAFENLIKSFVTHIGQSIKSAKKLAELMAGKARLLYDVLQKALTSDEENNQNSSLKDQMYAFKEILIHDITPEGFADIYAQTIAYGMFAARLHDDSLNTFSRQEAAELIPKSNPFLRRLFGYIAGPDIDDRIKWIVDNLARIFLATDIRKILKNYGKSTKMEDPIIHFYETFLAEYDPKLRKARGVWYTPAPVVNFIVRAVDDILKSEFDLPQGLADISKTKIKVDTQTPDQRSATGFKQIDKEVHKVQILDPATGTGTFLAEVIKHINKKFEGQEGIWSNYVENHLLPRLNGFELLMASYAMAHLQLNLLLTEKGYTPTSDQRLRVYLTNSLEEFDEDTGTLFANWLSSEANEANQIKRDTPVMCIIGNPPYSGESANKGDWIMDLMEDYKTEPGGKEKLKERNPKWINDDYVKFLRYGQHFIEKNGSGVLAFINPHGFLDNPTFRGMRWNLLKTYDKIYTIDLHGNAKKKETAPDGSVDENVFDIQQGVSINLFIKTGKKNPNDLGKVFHFDLYGNRSHKYDFLINNSLKTIKFNELPNVAPMYFMVEKDFEAQKSYDLGFKVNKLFTVNSVGIVTARDNFTIHKTKEKLIKTIDEFLNLEDENARSKFNLGKDVRDWKVAYAKKDLNFHYPNNDKIIKTSYRLFDNRWTFFTGNSKGFHCYPRTEVMQHFLKHPNLGIALCKQFKSGDVYQHVFITNKIIESSFVSNKTSEITSLFPLYLYPETTNQQSIEDSENSSQVRTPNLDPDIINKIEERLGLTFVPEKDSPSLKGCVQGGVAHDSTTHAAMKINEVEIQRNFINDLPYNSKLKQLAKDKRKEGILSEVLFWQQVHKGKFHNIDFDRQRVIGNYIVDFYVKSLGLIIEIDGDSHIHKEEYDAERQAYLESLGLKVYRIQDVEIKKNLEQVMHVLEDYIIAEYGEKATPVFDHPSRGEFAPIDLLDYIYAVLHSPSYREKYKEFLKIDFPRVPYPNDQDTFWKLVKLGGEIRQIHLLESPKVEQYITRYPKDGDNVVSRSITKGSPGFVATENGLGNVFINDEQYFENVPEVAWEFYIGGYQPAQKWLKDRRNRALDFDDILHYQKIIVALTETDRLMKEIDGIEFME